MKRILVLLLLFASTSVILCAQDKAPLSLFEAAQCLVNGKYLWVDVKDQKFLQLAYQSDAKTFTGAKYLYVIVFTSPKRDQGKVFDIQLKDHRTYSIENNATFVNTPKGVTFSEPPLGGTWRQTQLTTSVQQILHHHKWYEAEVKQLLKPSGHIRCETTVEDVVEPKK
jgi:hypothetical protein